MIDTLFVHDTVIKTIIDTIFDHDTIAKIVSVNDTLKLINVGKQPNNLFNILFPIFTLLIGFFANWIKDLLTNKSMNKELRNRIKYEKIYSRKIRVTEEIIEHLYSTTENLNQFLKNAQRTETKSSNFYNSLSDLRNYLNLYQIYLTPDLRNKIDKLSVLLMTTSLGIIELKIADEPTEIRRSYREIIETIRTDIKVLLDDIIKDFEISINE